MLSDVALETFQDSVLDWPLTIDAGVAVNEVMTGVGNPCVVAWTPAVCADMLPAES
jgi:hypothetical protein